MHKLVVVAVTGSSLMLQGCATIKADLHNPGGVFGRALDDHMIDASQSKQMQVLRAELIIAMVARAGTAYSHNGKESDDYANAILDAADEVNFLDADIADGPSLGCPVLNVRDSTPASSADLAVTAKVAADNAKQSSDAAAASAAKALISEQNAQNAYAQINSAITAVASGKPPSPIVLAPSAVGPLSLKPSTPVDTRCKTYRVNFESDVPLMERKLFNLMVVALPQDQARSFLDSFKGGNWLGLAWNAAKLALASVSGLHNAAAVNRTAIEVEASQETCEPGKKYNTETGTVLSAMQCLGIDQNSLFKSPARGASPVKISNDAFKAVMQNIQDSCRLISLNTDQDNLTVTEIKNNRTGLCDKITFKPRWRFDI